MAWESRKGKGDYYTRSRKVGGRVFREYYGAGEMGRAMAQLDTMDRQRKAVAAAQLQQERERFIELDTLLESYFQQGHAALVATLQGAGYHQHARGEWRRKRGTREADRPHSRGGR